MESSLNIINYLHLEKITKNFKLEDSNIKKENNYILGLIQLFSF